MQHNEFEGQAGAPGADAGTGTTAPGAAPDAGSEGAAGDSLEVRLAAADLQEYVRKMTRAHLPIVTEPSGTAVKLFVGRSPAPVSIH